MTRLAELERRIAELEKNRGALLRFCDVSSVDEKTGTARVILPDGENMVSMPLRVGQRRTLKDQAQELPDKGEQAICLFSGQGFEQGVILGAVFSDADQSPGFPAHVFYRKFEDGAELYYDREEHKLIAIIPNGTVDLAAGKEVTVSSEKTLTLAGAEGIDLVAPSLNIGGVGGGACEAAVNGNLKHKGNYDQTGNHSLSGDVQAGGRVTDSGGNTNHHSHP